MIDERVRIFDENRNPIGVVSRDEAHRVGHWHEVFQCWFVRREEGVKQVYLQLRSSLKKDFAGLYDITAAGHLMADESVKDGVREIEEELGVPVSYEELHPLVVMNASIQQGNFLDNEIANIFLFEHNKSFDTFALQKEEVAGIVQADFEAFYDLWMGKQTDLHVEGFWFNHEGGRKNLNQKISKRHFVPHESSYYETIVKEMMKYFNQIEDR
ncbi:NUDIX hydrolase [Pseudalkalibacillus hwajinpoensis]|uniref:NUDIX hydrolase n=1 Tax=Guptibacillus hwajinpoensis TaxID=208199 RepID=UPI001CD62AEF|nr:NUDIX domain-containing protein [Pseudalkalibacillus hwajinpoensis]MCA0990933.1 NUDIX domain-containing protein [Pseudalkalibacillus hwajinpoensis]